MRPVGVSPGTGVAVPGRDGPSERPRWHLGATWVAVGFAGAALMALAGPRLVGSEPAWWYSVRVPPGRAGNMVAFYVGMAALGVGWFGLGRRLASEPGARPREVAVVAALWCVPLVVGPALFSGDMYSYLAQGTILHLGHDPYREAPTVLARLGHARVLDAVSPFWRSTTAPYGPLFIGIVSGIVSVTGSNLVAGVVGARLVEVAGVALLAVFAPRLARVSGADPARAVWIAAASPLVLAQLVAAGHNDALMAGLVVAGVTLALEGRTLPGVALCALGATVKVPAAVAIVFLAVAAARLLTARAARLRLLGSVVALTGAVAAVVSAATGTGAQWMSAAVLATPAKVHLAITPVTALAWSAAKALGAVGVSLDYRVLDRALGDVALVAIVAFAGRLLLRTRADRVVADLGAALCVAALLGPATWPWYFCWGIVLLAAWPCAQRSRLVAFGVAASVLLVKPDGILAVPLSWSPVALACYLVAGVLAARWWRHRAQEARRAAPPVRAGAATAGP